MKKLPQWLQWLLVPFVAVLAYGAAYLLVSCLFTFAISMYFDEVPGLIPATVVDFAAPLAFVIYGTKRAPDHRFATSIGLAVLLSFGYGCGLVAFLLLPNGIERLSIYRSTIEGLLGAFVGVVMVKKSLDERVSTTGNLPPK